MAGETAAAPSRRDRSAGDQRSAKGPAVAWPCADANHRNVHASGSVGETGSPGIGGASQTALRALPSYRQADGIAKGGHSYAEQKTIKVTHWRRPSEADSA